MDTGSPTARTLLQRLGPWVVLLALLGVTGGLRITNWNAVFDDGAVYFADADCYARMSRVAIWESHPWRVIRHHDFENWPDGTTPHTTLPLDVLLAECATPIAKVIAPAAWRDQARDVAGAWSGVALALATAWVLWLWWRAAGAGWRMIGLAVFAGSPIAAHSQMLGRPDHQALLMFLLTVALAGEWRMGRGCGCGWRSVTGIAWGLAMWVSLYEPVIMFALAQGARCAAQGPAFFSRQRLALCLTAMAVATIGWTLEGRLPDPPVGADFERWAAAIGELQPANLETLGVWLGWMTALLLPWAAWNRETRAEGVLALGLAALTLWQSRWGSFAALAAAGMWLAAPALPWRGRGATAVLATLAVAGFLPMLAAWDHRVFEAQGAQAERLHTQKALRAAATAMRREPGPFVSAWWHAPAVAYWSGSPGVAGSSHGALPGIVRASRFWLGDATAVPGVRWIVLTDPAELQEAARAVVSTTTESPDLQDIALNPGKAPAGWTYQGGVPGVQLYEFKNAPRER